MEFRWNDWNVEHIAKHGVSPDEQMMKKKYWEMTARELAATTKQFDEPMVVDQSRPLTEEDREPWRRIQTKARSKAGQAQQRISVSIEKGLLERATALAKKRRVSRYKLVAIALEEALAKQG